MTSSCLNEKAQVVHDLFNSSYLGTTSTKLDHVKKKYVQTRKISSWYKYLNKGSMVLFVQYIPYVSVGHSIFRHLFAKLFQKSSVKLFVRLNLAVDLRTIKITRKSRKQKEAWKEHTSLFFWSVRSRTSLVYNWGFLPWSKTSSNSSGTFTSANWLRIWSNS